MIRWTALNNVREMFLPVLKNNMRSCSRLTRPNSFFFLSVMQEGKTKDYSECAFSGISMRIVWVCNYSSTFHASIDMFYIWRNQQQQLYKILPSYKKQPLSRNLNEQQRPKCFSLICKYCQRACCSLIEWHVMHLKWWNGGVTN